MTLEKMKEQLEKLQRERHAYQHAMACLNFDSETVAPRDSAEMRSVTMGFLSEKSYELFVNDDVRTLLDGLWEKKDELEPATLRQTELLREELAQMTRIPMDEYVAYSQLVNESGSKWLSAKESNDFACFEPYLRQVIDYQKRFAGYFDPKKEPYDALLNEYEKDMTAQTLDKFFAMLRGELVPLLKRVKGQPPEPAFLSGFCAVQKQRELSTYLMRLMGMDPKRSAISETEHPFTEAFNNHDVRIATHYYEHAVLSSMYSVIHENGHALYELDISDAYQCTALADAPSMGMHESQSRFYENMVGHDRGFLRFLSPKLRELFPEALGDVDDDALYLAINRVSPSLVRTEADEVTYPLHIMVRYELEKQLIGGTLQTRDLPARWNELYRENLGVTPPTDTLGVLQDMHWASGMIGYFPTYALGSAYAAQFMVAMRRELNVDALLAKGELAPINEWLRRHGHESGKLMKPAELLKAATGEDFNPTYYVDHLCKRVTDVYGK